MTLNLRVYGLCAFLSACLLFQSCAQYKPKAYVPHNIIRNQYLDDVRSKSLLSDYQKICEPSPATCSPDPETTQAAATRQKMAERRNQILRELIALIDQNYSPFEEKYYGSDAAINFGGDVANLGLTGVSSVTGTAHLKSVLSAVATGTTGIKTSYLKNFYDQQTRSAIVQKMRANRAATLAILQDQDHMKAPVVCPSNGCPEIEKAGDTPAHIVSPYSLEAGLADVDRYYQAGTIIGALQAIAETSGTEQEKAKTQQKTNSATRQRY